MFEKDAEKWVENNLHNTEEDYIKAFKDGAEFGYNKAFVEADKNLKAVVADFNKANKWHKADEKPKVTTEYLVYLISGYNCRSVTMMIYNAERGFWCADNQNDVVYWKEIVLPKEEE